MKAFLWGILLLAVNSAVYFMTGNSKQFMDVCAFIGLGSLGLGIALTGIGARHPTRYFVTGQSGEELNFRITWALRIFIFGLPSIIAVVALSHSFLKI